MLVLVDAILELKVELSVVIVLLAAKQLQRLAQMIALLVNAVTDHAVLMKTVLVAQQTAVNAVIVILAMWQIVLMMIAVQRAGLVMVLKTVKTRLLAVT